MAFKAPAEVKERALQRASVEFAQLHRRGRERGGLNGPCELAEDAE
jgi:hypothetical protein